MMQRLSGALQTLTPSTRWDVLDSTIFVAVVGLVVITGYLQGAMMLVIATPAIIGLGSIVFLQAIMACFTLSGLFGLSALTMFAQLRMAGDDFLPTSGPNVTAIVPVHRDGAVLNRSVESLLDSQYSNLRVLIVAEPDDDASIRCAREFTDDDRVDLLVNTGYPGSKAGAVNYAAEKTDSQYLAVFDADERVDARFVSAAVAKLDDADVVQGRTIPEPDGVVETVAYYESVILGDLSQRLLTLVTDFTMAASRTIVMRRSAFEAVNGYDPSMLTEDYDFAFACYETDLDVSEQLTYASTIEAAHTPTDWWGQRKRWMTGYAQVFHHLVAGCRSPQGYRSLVSPLICAGSVFGNLFMLSLVSKLVVLIVNNEATWLVLPVATLVLSALSMRAYDASRGRLDTVGVGWLLMPVIIPLYSLVGIKAFVEYVLSWDGEWYSVTKGI